MGGTKAGGGDRSIVWGPKEETALGNNVGVTKVSRGLNSGFNNSEVHGDASSSSGSARLQHDGAKVWLAIKGRGAFQETWLQRSETGTSSQDDLTLNFLLSQR